MKYFISHLILLLPLSAATLEILDSSGRAKREVTQDQIKVEIQDEAKAAAEISLPNLTAIEMSGGAIRPDPKFSSRRAVDSVHRRHALPLPTIPEGGAVHALESPVAGSRIYQDFSHGELAPPSDMASGRGDHQLNDYYNREQYISEHVRQLILTEARYNMRANVFNSLGSVLSWAGGVATAGTAFISALGASEYMNSRSANLTSTMLGVASGLCVWAGSQLKKTSSEYHKASIRIQLTLGIPKSVVSPLVDVRIDLPRSQADQADAGGQQLPRTNSTMATRTSAVSASPSRF